MIMYALYKLNKFITINKLIGTKNTDYFYYIKGLSYYKLNKKKIFDTITLKKYKRDQRYIKLSYIYFYNLIKKYPESKYIKKIIKKQKKLFNLLAKNKAYILKKAIKKNNLITTTNISTTIVNTYLNTKITKETLLNTKKQLKKNKILL